MLFFILSEKLVSLGYLNLSPDLFFFNFKIYNVINWDTNNRNTKYCQISQEVKFKIGQSKNVTRTVFVTHVGICRMPTWKAKSFYRVSIFLPTWFFLPLRKFRTIKIKLETNFYAQTNACLLHVTRNFKDIFKYICFTLDLQQTLNNWESAIIFIDHCCLPCFFSADIRSNQFRIDLII